MPRKNNKPVQNATEGGSPANLSARRATSAPVRFVADWLVEPVTQAVFEALNCGDVQTRAVGGAVRNGLIGARATDIDFATTASPQEITGIARNAGMSVHPTGIAHGTVTVVCQDQPFEVTTLRKDISTDGRRATVAFTTDWRCDAKRRDFTINALYCDGDGTLFDPLGGYADLMDRKVRFIGDPEARIREDFLRILRFFRFFAAFGSGPIDPAGLSACIKEKAGLKSLSGERIQGEILCLLVAKNSVGAVEVMSENAILDLALELEPDADTFYRLCAIEAALGVAPDGLLRLAALANGSGEEMGRLAQRLKLSNAQASRICGIAPSKDEQATQDTPLAALGEREQRVALYRLGRQTFEDRCLMEWARSGASPDDESHAHAFGLTKRWQPPALPFSGADLIARGFKQDPRIGLVLSQFETWWLEEDFPQSRELLENKLMEIAARD